MTVTGEKEACSSGVMNCRNELLKENGFYNQLYCGCEFSIRKEKLEESVK